MGTAWPLSSLGQASRPRHVRAPQPQAYCNQRRRRVTESPLNRLPSINRCVMSGVRRDSRDALDPLETESLIARSTAKAMQSQQPWYKRRPTKHQVLLLWLLLGLLITGCANTIVYVYVTSQACRGCDVFATIDSRHIEAVGLHFSSQLDFVDAHSLYCLV
jgi:hypothetical protein